MDRTNIMYNIKWNEELTTYDGVLQARQKLYDNFERDVAFAKENRDKLLAQATTQDEVNNILVQCDEELSIAKETLDEELKRLEEAKTCIRIRLNDEKKTIDNEKFKNPSQRKESFFKHPIKWLSEKLEFFKEAFHFFDPVMERLGKTLDTFKEHANDSKEDKARILNELEPELEYAKNINDFTKTNTFKEFLDGIAQGSVDNFKLFKAKFFNIEKNHYEQQIDKWQKKYNNINNEIAIKQSELRMIQEKRLRILNSFRVLSHKPLLELKDIAKETGKSRQKELVSLAKERDKMAAKISLNIYESQMVTEKQLDVIKNTRFTKKDLKQDIKPRFTLSENIETLAAAGIQVKDNVTEARMQALSDLLKISTINGEPNTHLVEAVIDNNVSVETIIHLTNAIENKFVSVDTDIDNNSLTEEQIKDLISNGILDADFVNTLRYQGIQTDPEQLCELDSDTIQAVDMMNTIEHMPKNAVENVINQNISLDNVKDVMIAANAAISPAEAENFVNKTLEVINNPQKLEDVTQNYENMIHQETEATKYDLDIAEEVVKNNELKSDTEILQKTSEEIQNEIDNLAVNELRNSDEPLTDIDGTEIPLAQYKFNIRDMHSMTLGTLLKLDNVEFVPAKNGEVIVSITDAKAVIFLEEKLAEQNILHEVSCRNWAMDKAVKEINVHKSKIEDKDEKYNVR